MNKTARLPEIKNGFVIAYDGKDHFAPLLMVRAFEGVDAFAIRYSGRYTNAIKKNPNVLRITSRHGMRYKIEAVAGAIKMGGVDDSVMIAVTPDRDGDILL